MLVGDRGGYDLGERDSDYAPSTPREEDPKVDPKPEEVVPLEEDEDEDEEPNANHQLAHFPKSKHCEVCTRAKMTSVSQEAGRSRSR